MLHCRLNAGKDFSCVEILERNQLCIRLKVDARDSDNK